MLSADYMTILCTKIG